MSSRVKKVSGEKREKHKNIGRSEMKKKKMWGGMEKNRVKEYYRAQGTLTREKRFRRKDGITAGKKNSKKKRKPGSRERIVGKVAGIIATERKRGRADPKFPSQRED